MASNVSEASWKAFTKKQKLELDDGALLKALAKFDRTDAARPEPRVQALDEVIEQAKRQLALLAKRKKELGDKPFNEARAELDALTGAAEKLLKEARAAVQATGSEDEEGDSPVLLTTKMLPLVRELRKGEVRMPALICVAGKDAAVLIMRRAISPARRKLLAEFIGAGGGAKYIPAECLFEEQALTFVVQSGAAGLAKRLKAALSAQVELRLKVRVRGEDPHDVDEEGEDDGAAAQGPSAPGAGPAAGSAPQPAATAPSSAGDSPNVEPATAFKARLGALMPRIQAALAASGPAAAAVKARVTAAGAAATRRDFDAAGAALDDAEKLLAAADALAAWQAVRKSAVQSLQAVAGKIASARHASSAKALIELNSVIKNLTESPWSQAQVDELRRYLGSDDVVHDVCDLDVDIRTPMMRALETLRALVPN